MDSRVFFKVDVGYFRNPKVLPLLEENHDAVLIHLAAIAYAREHLTDGIVPIRRVMADVMTTPCGSHCGTQCEPQCPRILLVQNGLIEDVDARTIRVHDYAEHNQTAADVEKSRAAGQKGAAARWSKRTDANRIAVGTATRSTERSADGNANPNAEERRGEEREGRAQDDAPTPAPKGKRGTRIPTDFNVTDDMRAWAAANGYGHLDLDRITAAFIDWWSAKAGPDGVKLDWVATWRNWIRKERPASPTAPTNRAAPADPWATAPLIT